MNGFCFFGRLLQMDNSFERADEVGPRPVNDCHALLAI